MQFASPGDITLATHAINATLHGIHASHGTRIEVGLALVVDGIRSLRAEHQVPVIRAVAQRIFDTFRPARLLARHVAKAAKAVTGKPAMGAFCSGPGFTPLGVLH